MVNVLAFYSNDPSSNPAEAYSFVFEKDENKQKEVLGCWSIWNTRVVGIIQLLQKWAPTNKGK